MRLEWAEQAELDLLDLAHSYDRSSPGLGDLMLERIEIAPISLLDHPHLGPPVGVFGVRKWPARNTPFILLYRVIGDTVEIVRIVHGMSDWRD